MRRIPSRRVSPFFFSDALSLRFSSQCVDDAYDPPRMKFPPGRIVPLTANDIRSVSRVEKKFLSQMNSRTFINNSGITSLIPTSAIGLDCDDTRLDGALSEAFFKLCPSISALVYDIGVPLALEQLTELLIPMLVFAEDAVQGRPSKGSLMLLDDMASDPNSFPPGHLFTQEGLSEEDAAESREMIENWCRDEGEMLDALNAPEELTGKVQVVDNEGFDRYFEILSRVLSEKSTQFGLFFTTDNDGRVYIMPGSSEYFLRRLYPCIRKDAYKSIWNVCLSAGWTGFGRSRLSDVEVIEAYFHHIQTVMGPYSPIEMLRSDLVNGAGDGSIIVRRKQDDYVLPSVNELSRFTRSALPSSTPTPPPPPPPAPVIVEGTVSFTPLNIPMTSPLHRLYTDIVVPQSRRVQTRGLSTLLAFLQSEKMLLKGFDERDSFELIALATRLSTPSFVLEVLASCPAKRAKDPTLGPLPSWCFPLFAGYFVSGDDMRGIAEMHTRAAVKAVLSYDKSDNDVDSLRNASLELKRMLFHHHNFLAPMHAHVLLCTFRFMQKHEQLHRALKKSIVAADDAQVKSSRIKEIIGNVNNTLTELEYCINTNLKRIPTSPLAPGRKAFAEDPEEVKLVKANALYQYWYLDWLASHC